MLHLRVFSRADQTNAVLDALTGNPAVSSVAVMGGASLQPPGDVVLADVALRVALRSLAIGFVAAIAITTLAALIGRALGWVVLEDLVGPRPGTAFIYTPDRWSFLLVLNIAGMAVAGWATLALQHQLWSRVALPRSRRQPADPLSRP